MTDTAYINARDYGDDDEGRRKLVDIDWSAWREQLENWLKRSKDSSERAYQSTKKSVRSIDVDDLTDKFGSAALGISANALSPIVAGMATMWIVRAGLVSLGAPALLVSLGFAAWSMHRSFKKAKAKYQADCEVARGAGEEVPDFSFKYWWPVVLKGTMTVAFMGMGVYMAGGFDMDGMPEASFLKGDVADADIPSGSDEALQSDAMGGAGAETDLNDVDGDVADIDAVQPISYDVEFGANFELPENPTAVDRMAAMMPDDVSPEVIEALEAARDGHVWGVHNLAYHLSFEHGGLELDEAGKQLVLDLYAEAASEGHQISIDNLATLENMWGMKAEGFDASAMASLNDSIVDDEISVIDAYVASLADDAPNPYDVIEVSDLPDITAPTVLGEVGQPYDLTANLGASLDGMPEGYTPTPAALGIDDGVTYGSGSFLEEDAIVTASNPSDAFAASTVVENAIAITPSQTVSFFDHEGLIRIASRDGLDLSQDVAFEFIAPNGDSQYTLVTGAQASQILDSDNPGALLQAMVEDSTGRQWAELNAPLQQETQFASLNGGGGERTLTLN